MEESDNGGSIVKRYDNVVAYAGIIFMYLTMMLWDGVVMVMMDLMVYPVMML